MAERQQTTISLWTPTRDLLKRVCERNGRSMQQQIAYWTNDEGRRLGLLPPYPRLEELTAGENEPPETKEATV